jgi:hypothetical protein
MLAGYFFAFSAVGIFDEEFWFCLTLIVLSSRSTNPPTPEFLLGGRDFPKDV